MEQNTVKQTENFGEVIGLLKSKKIKFGTSAKTGKNYANGSIEVEVNNQFGVNVLKIDVMQMELTTSGKENKNYKALQTINTEYKTIEEHGAENADLIQVFIKVEENNYLQEGEVVEGIKLLATTNYDKGVFAPIKRIADKNTQQKIEVSFGGMITKIIPNENTGELKVEMVGATYTGKAIKHKLDVSKELADGFRTAYQEGYVTTLHYIPVNAVEIKEVKKEVAFGTAPSFNITNTTRKNLIVGGDVVDYDSEMTQEVVKQMLMLRNVELEKIKEEKQQSKADDVVSFGGNTGMFGGNTGIPSSNPFAV